VREQDRHPLGRQHRRVQEEPAEEDDCLRRRLSSSCLLFRRDARYQIWRKGEESKNQHDRLMNYGLEKKFADITRADICYECLCLLFSFTPACLPAYLFFPELVFACMKVCALPLRSARAGWSSSRALAGHAASHCTGIIVCVAPLMMWCEGYLFAFSRA
jgi:hypothetical protein